MKQRKEKTVVYSERFCGTAELRFALANAQTKVAEAGFDFYTVGAAGTVKLVQTADEIYELQIVTD